MNPINMQLKIINDKKSNMKLDCKRLNIPAKIDCRCPECGEPVYADYSSDDYLAYPKVNTKFEVNAMCPNEHEFRIKVKLTVTLEEA